MPRAPLPLFSFRMSADDARNVVEMAKVFGSPTVSAFCREVLGTVASGDVERVRALTMRMVEKTGEQLKLSLNASLDEASKAQKPAKKARKSAGRGKPVPKSRKGLKRA